MLLNCHSCYSYKYGAIPTDELVETAQNLGYETIALTDINTTSACIDFVKKATNNNIKPIVGIDFRNGIDQQFIGLAKNIAGFRELNEFLSEHLHNKKRIAELAPEFKNSYIIYPFENTPNSLRINEYIGIAPDDLIKLSFSHWKNHQEKLVILKTSSFRHKRDFNVHRLLRAIGKNLLLSKLPLSEQAEFKKELFLSKKELLEIYRLFPTVLANTALVMSNCSINFEFGTNKNKRLFTDSETEDFERLKKECYKGIAYRYDSPSKKMLNRLEKELKVIRELNFCTYFLINYEIINYAQQKKYYYVGRGSGANSLVAYLLRITNVDPIELDLYFERFINPYRSSPPDFDIDFSWTDRDDVTRFIFERFGYDHVALLGTYITFNRKSAIREIGKVFGIPDESIKKIQNNPDKEPDDEYGKWVIKYSKYIADLPNQNSIHSCGILISEKPISTYTATELMPKGFPSTQFDMYVAEDVGLHKFDILSQRGLGKIKDAIAMIYENKNIAIDIDQVDKIYNDQKVRKLLQKGKAIGCFYIESPAMRMLLTKLKASDYKRLVAASSIIRPGVAQSGMMKEYIIRFQNPAKREEARKAIPHLYEILEETYGVMVYQEDVIKVAHYFAGLSLDEADVLRRGMSWKFRERSEFWKVKYNFFKNCKDKNYSNEVIGNIWNQIESFANYAFAKGHSASYAVESFQALYLKAHHPIEYMTATLNNGGGYYRPEIYFHEARMHGAKLELPCINKSVWLNSVEENSIYIGFYLLQELETETAKKILLERNTNGNFQSLSDFTQRIPISIEQLSILIRIGAFRFTGLSKKELLWNTYFLLNNKKKSPPQNQLFKTETKSFRLPQLNHNDYDDALDELELLGFTIQSPFNLIKNEINVTTKAQMLPEFINKKIEIVGYLVTRKPTRTKNKEIMCFGTWLDIEGQWIDTVHFPPSFKKYPFRGPGCYSIFGKVVEEYGFYTIEVEKMERLSTISMD